MKIPPVSTSLSSSGQWAGTLSSSLFISSLVSLLIHQSPWGVKVTFTVKLHQTLTSSKSLPTLTNRQILLT